VLQDASATSTSPVPTTHNLGITFDSNTSMSDHISALCKSPFSLNHDLEQIWSCLDHNSAATTVMRIIHSRLDYCNSFCLNHPASQSTHLQLIHNATAQTKTRTIKLSYISSVPKSLHWLKCNECFQFQIPSLTYEVHQTNQLVNLHNLLIIQPVLSTHFLPLLE
jgi:hypothetical protein